MANVKDPQKVAPPPFGAPKGTKALRESDTAAPKKRDDFSWSLDNMLRWWAQDLDEARNEQDEVRLQDVQQFQALLDTVSFEPLGYADLLAKGELTDADILRINPRDEQAMNMRMAEVVDYQQGRRYYLVGKSLEQYETRRSAESFLAQQGIGQLPSGRPQAALPPSGAAGAPSSYRAPEFRVTTPAVVQGELVASIDKAAKITGVPTALLGAMTGIESGFGKNLLSPTGAIGVMQQTGGYRDTMWKTYGETIAQHVPAARAAMAGGLSKDEKRDLAFNNDAAILMVALRAKDFCKKYGLDVNDPKSWGMVYLDHNSGEGSVMKLMSGQMTDKFIRDVNPAVYRGVNTPQEALANFQSKIVGYAKAYEKVEARYEASSPAMAAAKPAADAAILKASGKAPAPVIVGANGKPEPVPS